MVVDCQPQSKGSWDETIATIGCVFRARASNSDSLLHVEDGQQYLNHGPEPQKKAGLFTSQLRENGNMFLLWWIIVGLIAGWITGKLMKGSGYGVIMDIVIGIIGAIVGGFIVRALGFAGEGGMIYTIIVAVIGAVILTWIIHLIKKA